MWGCRGPPRHHLRLLLHGTLCATDVARSIRFQPPCSKTVSYVPRLSPWKASWGEYIFIVYLLYPHGAAPFYFPFRSSPHCTCVVFCLGQILVALFFSYQGQESVSQKRELLGLSKGAGPRALIFFLFRLILPV